MVTGMLFLLFRLQGKEIDEREVWTEELLNLHRGQGMDLYWRESLIVPTEAEYIEMVNNSAYFLWFRRRTIETDYQAGVD